MLTVENFQDLFSGVLDDLGLPDHVKVHWGFLKDRDFPEDGFSFVYCPEMDRDVYIARSGQYQFHQARGESWFERGVEKIQTGDVVVFSTPKILENGKNKAFAWSSFGPYFRRVSKKIVQKRGLLRGPDVERVNNELQVLSSRRTLRKPTIQNNGFRLAKEAQEALDRAMMATQASAGESPPVPLSKPKRQKKTPEA